MLEGLRILVVDDQQTMRMLVASALRSIGVRDIASAEDGVKALSILRSRPIDVVLLDVEMPNLGGVDTLKEIRASEKFASLPVIMMTGRADLDLVAQIRSLVVSGYLVKPVTAEGLKKRLKAILSAS